MHKLFHFVKSQALIQISYSFYFLSQFLTGLFYFTIFFFIAKYVPVSSTKSMYGGDFFSFAFLGFSMYSFLFLGVMVFSERIREHQLSGVLEYLFTTSTSPLTTIFGISLWSIIRGFINFGIYMITGIVFFSFSFDVSKLVPLTLVLVLTVIAVSTFGLIAAAFTLLFKQNFTYWFTAFLGVFSGVFFPIEVLPSSLQLISWLSPLTYSLDAVRGLLIGSLGFQDILVDIAALAGFIIVMLPLSLLILSTAFKIARKYGTLGEY